MARGPNRGTQLATTAELQLAHLFRKAAFGARPSEMAYYASRGYAKAVEDLVAARPFAEGSPPIAPAPAKSTDDPYDRVTLRAAQARWLQTMVTTTTPLVEKMALFLHDHFATSFMPGAAIGVPQMEAQLRLFRTYALGNFRTLCRALIDDMALACWLDADRNQKGAPNENLAREFMELFTLGRGNYTERDVREAARALTGYRLVKDESAAGIGMRTTAQRVQFRLVFDSKLHDYGEKTFLGATGTFMPKDLADVALRHPAAAKFVASRLVATFQATVPNTVLVDKVAQALTTSGWELAPALRALLSAPEFSTRPATPTTVMPPVDFVAQAMRALGRTEYDKGVAMMTAAGQSLLEPPSVAGWTPNEGWLGSGELLGRYNAGATLAKLHTQLPAPGLPASAAIDDWTTQFTMLQLTATSRAGLNRYLADTARLATAQRQSGLITLLIASPEFSLT